VTAPAAAAIRVGLAAVLAGCGHRAAPTAPSPVRVHGAQADQRALEGSWSGEFRDERTGRGGTIRFVLVSGQDTAYARVLVHGAGPRVTCGDPLSEAVAAGDTELVLRLAWLSVDQGSVGGWLQPYHDPEAGCVMDTWFEGLARRNRIEGSYFARPTDGRMIRVGKWEVRRER
jgi:hypothetical protein